MYSSNNFPMELYSVSTQKKKKNCCSFFLKHNFDNGLLKIKCAFYCILIMKAIFIFVSKVSNLEMKLVSVYDTHNNGCATSSSFCF